MEEILVAAGLNFIEADTPQKMERMKVEVVKWGRTTVNT